MFDVFDGEHEHDFAELPVPASRSHGRAVAELGVATELDTHEDGSALWRADPVGGNWTDETTLQLSPVIIAVYGTTSTNDDFELFIERHGKAALAPAVTAIIDYLKDETTRRGVADDLNIPAVEAIVVTQAIKRIIAVVKDSDPIFDDISFDVEIHQRAIKQAPYQRADE